MRRFLVIGSALALACGVAIAEPEQKTAQEQFKLGNTAYNLGRWDEAIDHFTKAYEAWPQPEFLYNIAQSHRLAGNCKLALHFYKRFRSLKDADTASPLTAKKREEIDRFINQLTECAAKADTSARTPPDTIVQPAKSAALTPVPQTAQSAQHEAHIDADAATTTPVARSSGGHNMKVAGLVTVGSGLGLVITGAVFGVKARSAESDVEDAAKNGQPYDPDLDATGRRDSKISGVVLGVGAAAVMTGGILYVLGNRSTTTSSTREARLRIIPRVSTETAGLTLDVRY